MKFIELDLKGAFILELEPHIDQRGHFARTFCLKEFERHNLVNTFVQMSTAFNNIKGQVRGMHYQAEPFAETKIVRVIKGSVIDVIIDLREDSQTFNQWHSIVLSDENNKMLYIPKGFAHGYKTLENNTELFYMMDEYYYPQSAREIEPRDIYWM